ncbi:MAG: hypothetical protein N2746_10190 [Deltaproteobacteria bacterium]|nr:hypothetical protein [Deltaproteobacteria bacterium]
MKVIEIFHGEDAMWEVVYLGSGEISRRYADGGFMDFEEAIGRFKGDNERDREDGVKRLPQNKNFIHKNLTSRELTIFIHSGLICFLLYPLVSNKNLPSLYPVTSLGHRVIINLWPTVGNPINCAFLYSYNIRNSLNKLL